MDAENDNKQKIDIDQWLDAALKARIDAEPRMGLEERVLARLAAEPQRKVLTWWRPALAGVAAIVAIALVLVSSHSSNRKPTRLNKPQAASRERIDSHNLQANATPPQQPTLSRAHNRLRIAPSTPDQGVRRSVSVWRSARTAAVGKTQQESLPRLATFPAPQPETSEERLLARLAAQRGSFVVASLSTDLVPLKVLPVPEFTIRPLEEAPEDDASPQ